MTACPDGSSPPSPVRGTYKFNDMIPSFPGPNIFRKPISATAKLIETIAHYFQLFTVPLNKHELRRLFCTIISALLTRVHAEMLLVRIFIRKALATNITSKRQRTRMASPVRLQRSFGHEAVSAELARMWLIASLVVCLDVRGQPSGAGELAAAHITVQRLVLVSLQVFGQTLLQVEHLRAQVTLVRLVARVSPPVRAQRGERHKPLSTVVTSVRRLARVPTHVFAHAVLAQLLVADGAGGSVRCRVRRQLLLGPEAQSTEAADADVGGVRRVRGGVFRQRSLSRTDHAALEADCQLFGGYLVLPRVPLQLRQVAERAATQPRSSRALSAHTQPGVATVRPRPSTRPRTPHNHASPDRLRHLPCLRLPPQTRPGTASGDGDGDAAPSSQPSPPSCPALRGRRPRLHRQSAAARDCARPPQETGSWPALEGRWCHQEAPVRCSQTADIGRRRRGRSCSPSG